VPPPPTRSPTEIVRRASSEQDFAFTASKKRALTLLRKNHVGGLARRHVLYASIAKLW
jgi:hypothetical protein